MKLALFFCLHLALVFNSSYAQVENKINKALGAQPAFFLDSVEVSSDEFQKINPLFISNITVLHKRTAKKVLGEKGADGAVYVITIKFANECYWKFLSSVSDQYKQIVPFPAADSTVLYELNGEVLTSHSARGSLFHINKKTFRSLKIRKNTDSMLGGYIIAIKAKRPKGAIKLSSFKS